LTKNIPALNLSPPEIVFATNLSKEFILRPSLTLKSIADFYGTLPKLENAALVPTSQKSIFPKFEAPNSP